MKDILDLIGNTPVVKLRGFDTGKCEIFLKLESQNPAGSIKDRIALTMIRAAEKRGDLKPGATLIEATSGNTGLGLALIAAQLGYHLILVIPDKMSKEKISHLRAMGAEVITTRSDVMKGHSDYYQDRAEALSKTIPNSWYVNQFCNQDNPKTHYEWTGPEIWQQFEHKLDAIVCAVGSSGTITGLSRYFAEVAPDLELVLADPKGSILAHYVETGEVLKDAGSWLVEGIGEDFIPEIADFSRVKKAYSISDEESLLLARELLKTNGILGGSSTGTLLAAALKYAREQTTPKRIMTFVCDNGNKYLSKQFNDTWMKEQGIITRPKTGDLRDLIGNPFAEGQMAIVKPDETLMIAFQRMKSAGVNELPVIDQGRVVGIIDGSDILPHVYQDGSNFKQLVGSVMITKLEKVLPSDPIDNVIALIKRNLVPMVSDDQHFYGFITRDDLLQNLKSNLKA